MKLHSALTTFMVVLGCSSFSQQWQSTGNNISNTNSGNVGIGISTPGDKLTINGGGIGLTNFGNSVYINGNVNSNNTGQLAIYSNSSATNGAFIYLWGKDNTYTYKSGSVDLVSYGSSGHGIRFANYSPITLTWTDQMVLTKEGKLMIGKPEWITTPGNYKLYVQDGILTERVKVALKTTGDWADYVFDKHYKLPSFAELEKYIQQNNHLPGVPSADEMVEQGNDLAKTDAKLLEKIEELTLYIIELNKRLQQQEKEIEALKNTSSSKN